jgi:hypothetical protein
MHKDALIPVKSKINANQNRTVIPRLRTSLQSSRAAFETATTGYKFNNYVNNKINTNNLNDKTNNNNLKTNKKSASHSIHLNLLR